MSTGIQPYMLVNVEPEYPFFSVSSSFDTSGVVRSDQLNPKDHVFHGQQYAV